MTQNSVRQRLNQYILEKGVKQSFICEQIQLNNVVLSQFKKDKKELYPKHLGLLDQFLKQENY